MVNGNIYFYCTRLTLRFLTVSGIAVRSVFMAQTHLAKQDYCCWIVYYDTRCDHRCLLTLVTSLCLNVVQLLSYHSLGSCQEGQEDYTRSFLNQSRAYFCFDLVIEKIFFSMGAPGCLLKTEPEYGLLLLLLSVYGTLAQLDMSAS